MELNVDTTKIVKRVQLMMGSRRYIEIRAENLSERVEVVGVIGDGPQWIATYSLEELEKRLRP